MIRNLQLPHRALGRFGEADRIKVSEALELTGIASFAGRLVDTLSGGARGGGPIKSLDCKFEGGLFHA
ncbi:hypothetical protein [Rhizobium sullae]|uniref:hypothetical protein n=1 Tax=Rhizobium sullae TaxID=50338 RepID=UPI00104AA7A0|nr:hypothetical protein [Rhizobium sullae]